MSSSLESDTTSPFDPRHGSCAQSHPAIQALAAHGRVVISDDHDDARAAAIASAPDIIIVDALAEGIPVEQRVAALRRNPGLALVPIVVTGVPVAEPMMLVRLFEAGADDCVARSADARAPRCPRASTARATAAASA